MKHVKIASMVFLSFMVSACTSTSVEPSLEVQQITEEVLETPILECTITTGEQTPLVREVSFAVVGDIMVHSYQYNEAYDWETGTYDFSHNFQDMKEYFTGYDFVLGNLETTFGGYAADYPMFSTPDEFMETLVDAGFNVLSTANNHSMDAGAAGVVRTLDVLDAAGMDHFGTYRSEEEQNEILIIEKNGLEVAFLSYTYGTNGLPVPEDYLVNVMNETTMVEQIRQAEEMADLVVMMPHMGNEYESAPREIHKAWIDLMIESGADIIFASHPHVLQPMEYRQIEQPNGEITDGFVIYSLGNFISSQTDPPRNASIVLYLTVEQVGTDLPTVKEVEFMPIWTQFQNVNYQNHFVVRVAFTICCLYQKKNKMQ
ncbi:CapA family protein [Chakrabartyella piscis]|uniref:CapA family protein n=1 Tax=Chakrabartyella piscis TaxID=2918914 RepID=UPI002958A21E|nr:CapA family protein [Chakrabartyella piscis]